MQEESDLLLGFAVAGASRVLGNGLWYTMPPSSVRALDEWVRDADPVAAWVAAQVTVIHANKKAYWVTSARAHEQFTNWCRAQGFRVDRLPLVNGFTQRVRTHALGVEIEHGAKGNRLIGIRIGPKEGDDDDV